MARSRLLDEIRYRASGEYVLYNEQGKVNIEPDSPEYFLWLGKLPSFHFKGKHGHFTARQEHPKQETVYWYVYRTAKKKQFKKYLGTTDKLTLARMETEANHLTQLIANEPEPLAIPRKRQVEAKADLRARIRELEKVNQQQIVRIQELEQELHNVKSEQAMRNYRRIIREHKISQRGNETE
jgi:hypothetical protein